MYETNYPVGLHVRFKYQDKTGTIVEILTGCNTPYKIKVDAFNYEVWLPACDFRTIDKV